MTFILAIQLPDSVIVAADNKCLTLSHQDNSIFAQDQICKLYPWQNGVITGAGEAYVIYKTAAFFIKFTDANLRHLPKCLQAARLIRTHEVGQHTQIQGSKLLYSNYCEKGAQLFSIEPENAVEDKVHTLKPYELILWLVHPEIHHISTELNQLYAALKNHCDFYCTQDWIDFYTALIAPIFYQQSLYDATMSPSFDLFFQNKTEMFYRHMDNG